MKKAQAGRDLRAQGVPALSVQMRFGIEFTALMPGNYLCRSGEQDGEKKGAGKEKYVIVLELTVTVEIVYNLKPWMERKERRKERRKGGREGGREGRAAHQIRTYVGEKSYPSKWENTGD